MKSKDNLCFSMSETDWRKAKKYLSEKDPVMKRLIDQYPFKGLQPHGRSFETLFRAIVGQQISVIAADRVWERIQTMTTVSDPIAILNLPENSLRSQGLSSRKIEYVNALAEAFVTGFISDERLRKSTDLEVIQHLTQIRGIGRWTSEMFLIFHLTRPNVFPWDDIGLHKGLIKNYRLRKPVTQRHHDRFKKLFSPWCTVAVWYLWRDLDPVPVHY